MKILLQMCLASRQDPQGCSLSKSERMAQVKWGHLRRMGYCFHLTAYFTPAALAFKYASAMRKAVRPG